MEEPGLLTAPEITEAEIVESPGNPLDIAPATFRAGLERRTENRRLMMEWIREALVEGSDYGKIHVVGKNKCDKGRYCKNPAHFSKASLFKPGAEKICGMLGLRVRFPSLADIEQAATEGRKLETIIIRCELVDASGQVVGSGIGGRIVSKDYGDINKSLKMAEKSAHVDAVLRTAGLSEVFTQDIEDMKKFTEEGNGRQENRKPTKPPQADPKQDGGSGPKTRPQDIPPGGRISEAQHRRLEAQISKLQLARERVKELCSKWFGVFHLNHLGKNQYAHIEKFLEKMKAQTEKEFGNPEARLKSIERCLSEYLKDFDEPPEGDAAKIVSIAWRKAGERHGEWPTDDPVDHEVFFKIVQEEIDGRVPVGCRDCEEALPSVLAARADGWMKDSPRKPGPPAWVCPECQRKGGEG